MDDNASKRPLFAVGGDVYGWEDVVRLARLGGEWETVVVEARAGLVALRELESRGAAPEPDDVEEAGQQFRYARGLLAGDELSGWLEQRGLTSTDWRDYLRRRLACDALDEPPEHVHVSIAEVDACAWVDGICSGRLDVAARTLARMVAVAPGVPLERLHEEFAAFCETVANDHAIGREIEANKLEWLRIRYESIEFDNKDAAAEAAFCVQTDGLSLPEVAGRAGASVSEHVAWLDEVEPELGSRLLAARPGDVIGSLQLGERYLLLQVQEKTSPSSDDEAVRARAARAVVDRVVAREVNERVIWLEPL